MTRTEPFLILQAPGGRAFALENPLADCKLGVAKVVWSGTDRDEWRHRVTNLNAVDVPGPLGKLAAAAVVRYGIIDSRTGGTSSAFAVPPGDTTAWSSTAAEVNDLPARLWTTSISTRVRRCACVLGRCAPR